MSVFDTVVYSRSFPSKHTTSSASILVFCCSSNRPGVHRAAKRAKRLSVMIGYERGVLESELNISKDKKAVSCYIPP